MRFYMVMRSYDWYGNLMDRDVVYKSHYYNEAFGNAAIKLKKEEGEWLILKVCFVDGTIGFFCILPAESKEEALKYGTEAIENYIKENEKNFNI